MMEERAKNQTRVTLKDVHKMLDGMSVELAEKVHLAIGRQRMISAIGLPMSGITSSRPCRRR